LGWEVLFVTDALTWIDWLKGDYRFKCFTPGSLNRVVKEMDRFYSYVVYYPWRPARVRFEIINKLTYRWFAAFGNIPLPGLEPHVLRADLFIFESSTGLMFFERFKSLNSHARFVYRVSDDLRIFNTHDVMHDTERRIAHQFDVISTTTPSVFQKFAGIPNVKLDYHGVPCHLYDHDCENPYSKIKNKNAIFVGTGFLDTDFLARAGRLFPEITFHIIGALKKLPNLPNVISYGEMPYLKTIPYVKYADIGLSPRTGPTLQDSNKIMQYTYCRLPIVTSDLNPSDKPHVFCYHPGNDASILQAMNDAIGFDRGKVPSSTVQSWDQLTRRLVGPLYNEN